jgi:hypothetical protein
VKEGWRSLVSWVNPGAGAAGRPVDAPKETVHVQPVPSLIPTSESPAAGAAAAGAGAGAGAAEEQGKPADLTA